MIKEAFSNSCFINAKLFALEIAALMKSNDEAIYYYGDEEGVEEIETQPRDGFIPRTSGGYEVCLPAFISHHVGTGCAPYPIQSMIDEGASQIEKQWADDYPDRPPFTECACAGDSDPAAQWREEAWQYEREWWEGDSDCYFWKARAMFLAPDDRQNETGKPEVYIDAYLCTDSYGRDNIPWLRCYGANPNQTVGTFKVTIPADEFAAMDSTALHALAVRAVDSLP